MKLSDQPLSKINPDGTPYEEVEHPDHYTWHPAIECIAVSEHFTANLAQAIQYIWRCGRKPGVEAEKDLRKAIWFIEREIKRLGS